jgi:Holliday junction resolvase RusA-like endonuclease
MLIEFTVPAVPVAQPRQRTTADINDDGVITVQNYTPTKHAVNAFKATVRMVAASVYKGAPLEGPLRMEIVLVFPRPRKLIWKVRPMPRQWHTIAPDSDNVAKAVKDSLSKLTFRDDSQICDLIVKKFIAAGDEQPHAKITIQQCDAI